MFQNSIRAGRGGIPTSAAAAALRFPSKRASTSALAVGEVAGVLDRLALNRRPRADLALARPRREVRVGLLVAHHRHGPRRAPDSRAVPVKAHRRDRMRAQLAPLPALEIRVEHEAALVHRFHEDDSHGRDSAHSDRRERHRVRLGQYRAI